MQLPRIAKQHGLLLYSFADLSRNLDAILAGLVGGLWGILALGFVVAAMGSPTPWAAAAAGAAGPVRPVRSGRPVRRPAGRPAGAAAFGGPAARSAPCCNMSERILLERIP